MGFLTIFLILGSFSVIYAQLPPLCSRVFCAPARCMDPIRPRGQCCAICPGFDKPGRCPHIDYSFGICVSECTWDSDCPGRDKCCSNGCGQVCTTPVYGGQRPRCFGVMCPLLGCPYGLYTPPGRCCPVCRRRPGPGEIDCSAVSCFRPSCSRLFTPPGHCCPVCLGGSEHLYD